MATLVLEPSNQLASLFATIRSVATARHDFVSDADRIMLQVVQRALDLLPYVDRTVSTPCGLPYTGLAPLALVCGVSIMRAGEAMEPALRKCLSCPIGKILIQRDHDANAKLMYHKLPLDIAQRFVFLMDPMLATGGTAIKGISVLLDHGVAPDRIVLVTVLACPEGIQRVHNDHPLVRIVTGHIDPRLDANSYIVPGLGDFGCRYFGTD